MASVADPIRELARRLPAARRAALEEVFLHWHGSMAPEHFRRAAFSRYPADYAASAKRDAEEWRRRHSREIRRGFRKRDANPLRESGRLERAFLSGSVLFSGSTSRLRARWPNLPTYATRPNRHSGFQAAQALVTVSEEERLKLSILYREWITRNLRNLLLLRPRTQGRLVIHL